MRAVTASSPGLTREGHGQIGAAAVRAHPRPVGAAPGPGRRGRSRTHVVEPHERGDEERDGGGGEERCARGRRSRVRVIGRPASSSPTGRPARPPRATRPGSGRRRSPRVGRGRARRPGEARRPAERDLGSTSRPSSSQPGSNSVERNTVPSAAGSSQPPGTRSRGTDGTGRQVAIVAGSALVDHVLSAGPVSRTAAGGIAVSLRMIVNPAAGTRFMSTCRWNACATAAGSVRSAATNRTPNGASSAPPWRVVPPGSPPASARAGPDRGRPAVVPRPGRLAPRGR